VQPDGASLFLQRPNLGLLETNTVLALREWRLRWSNGWAHAKSGIALQKLSLLSTGRRLWAVSLSASRLQHVGQGYETGLIVHDWGFIGRGLHVRGHGSVVVEAQCPWHPIQHLTFWAAHHQLATCVSCRECFGQYGQPSVVGPIDCKSFHVVTHETLWHSGRYRGLRLQDASFWCCARGNPEAPFCWVG
jgi:hypothetical protein